MKKAIWLRLAAVLLLAALLTPAALAADIPAATKGKMKVYTPTAPYKYVGTLPKGTYVTVVATKKNAALIRYANRYLAAPLSSLMKTVVVPTTNVPVVTLCSTRVYQRASTSSAYVNVKAGTEMTLIAASGSVARVKYKGKVGYTLKEHLRRAFSLSPQPTPRAEEIFTGTNQQIIIKFMMQKLGYSYAAACGVAANVWYECQYEPTNGGDHGSSYGIVQWHADRKVDLINWCAAHGYDHRSLKGQLYYLMYDLTTNYPKTNAYMKSLGNTAQDAYEAGYYFCYHFEAPASRSSQSKIRGNYARDNIYLKRS